MLTRSQHLPLPTLLSNLQEAYWEPCGFWTSEEAQNLGLYKLPLFWAAPTFLNYAEMVFRISMGRGGNNLLTLDGRQHPEVSQKLSHLLFPDQGRQNMLVMCATGIDSSNVYDKAGGFSAAQTSIGG